MPISHKTELKEKQGLSTELKEELGHLLMQVRAPLLLHHLKQFFLTKKESRLVGNAVFGRPAPGEKWVSALSMVRVVAQQRALSLERALLELARSVDLIGPGKYEQLRKAIGEPVIAETDLPKWNAAKGELLYRDNGGRQVAKRAKNCRRILDAFEEEGWPAFVYNPLPPSQAKRPLSEAVRNLNGGLSGLKFFCDGSGVFWRPD